MPGSSDEFLIDRDPVRWSAPPGFPASLRPAGMFAQDAPGGLEVVLVETVRKPTAPVMRKAWSKRRAGRASPVLLVALYPALTGERVSLCGPSGEQPVVHHDLEASQVERLADVALDEPNHHAATRFLLASLAELDSPVPGLRNVGLLATHELTTGVPEMDEWATATRRSAPLLRVRGRRLVESLGYSVEQLSTATTMLRIGRRNRAIAVFCDEQEPFDAPADRFGGATPVSRGLADADKHGVDWVILTRAAEIRLYAARPDTGVGRKGRSETFVEVNLSLLPRDQAGYLHLLFSADALMDEGTFNKILGASERFAAELATRLRERVYYDAVPALARAVADRIDCHPSDDELDEAYEQVMLILFRLLFVAYAEDKDLLPYSSNDRYHQNSLKLIARRLLEDRQRDRDHYDHLSTHFWDRIRALWYAVDQGMPTWGVPAYNGGLFSAVKAVSPSGAELATLRLTDAEFAPVLARLLIDETPEGEGPVDFRALSVREFGTIYEGLLESRLAVAQDDLAVRKLKGKNEYTYFPAGRGDSVEVEAGRVYLHNRLGVRKATGSYFTKPFAVEHLLDHALEKALDDHIQRLDRLRDADDQAGLADAFFDFRCADIAMGSGHFLVAALDRIEARLSAWLALHPLPSITNELDRLRSTALRALGELGVGVDIESGALIRRQVARHCVYGVDRNRVAVELARLAIWVHTFVPGLPLSFLDHNLVCGDSLTGVGTLDEVVAEFEPDADSSAPSLFRTQLEDLMSRSASALLRLAHTSDATKREIDQARAAHHDALKAVAGARALFDVVAAHRAGACPLPEDYELEDEATFIHLSQRRNVRQEIARLNPVHFPAAFPEVFLRERPGFDCILGNPPWEKVKVEKHQWWGRHKPGIRALSVGKMNAVIKKLQASRPDLDQAYQREVAEAEHMSALMRRTFDLGAGDTDLYQAFGWRYWHLTADGGAVGIVLPSQALVAPGYKMWRKTVLANGTFSDVTSLLNSRGWVFDDVHPQYIIALLSLRKGQTHAGELAIRGPYASPLAHSHSSAATRVNVEEFESWSETAMFPSLPSDSALATFHKLRNHPRLDRLDQHRFRAESKRGIIAEQSRAEQSRAEQEQEQEQELAGSSVHRAACDGRQGLVCAGRWRVRPYRELDAAKDKHRFVLDAGRTAMSAGTDMWPVYTGKSFNLWNADTRKPYASVNAEDITAHLQEKRRRGHKNKRSVFSEFPEDWIDDPQTLPCKHPRILFRDVTNATNTRTVITALVPGRLVTVHKAPCLLWPVGTARDAAYLLGILSSMILDWYARRFVQLSLTYSVLNSFPIPKADPTTNPVARRLVEIAGRLAAVDDRFSGWAEEVGVPIGSVKNEPEKYDLICELDACVAHLYGLDEGDLAVIYSTFHATTDYSERHAAVLEHFRRWEAR